MHVARAATARIMCAALTLGLLTTLAPGPAAASPAPAAPAADRVQPADPLLEEPTGGAAAVRELGDRLPAVARANDLTPRGLESLLRTDGTARLGTDGRLFYVEPAPAERPEPVADRALVGQAVAPLADTFALHSKPGALRTILLDVDGHTMGDDTRWGAVGTTHPAWDPGRNGVTFDDAERAAVQRIWSMVAEDFAAYDVDVTTQDPGPAGIERANTLDQTYGTRALISPSNAWSVLCNEQCGGVAYVDVFNVVGSDYQPAWVFPQGLADSPSAIAEATSHEVGHNLGLQHDGIGTDDYYTGHGSWAPIMGVGYERPITQWSRGEYAGATSSQDDLAVIGGYLARRSDEPAGTPPRTGYVTSGTDVDTFALGQCTGGSRVVVRSPSVSPDLDVRARLLAPDGTVLATADPPSGTLDATRSFGMDAWLTVPSAGRYVVDVTGVGSGVATGSAPDGYSSYGSIGAYEVVAAGCDKDLAGVPGSPVGLAEAAAPTPSTLSVSWAAPGDAGASPVTGYLVSGGAGPDLSLGPEARAATLDGLTGSTAYDVSVTAVNARGPGAAAVLQLTTAASPVTVPTAPRNLMALWSTADRRAEVYWRPPSSDGGSPVTGYALTVDGRGVGRVPAEADGVYLVGSFAPGVHSVGVAAVNAAGTGPAATEGFTVPTTPGAPTAVTASAGPGQATVRWTAPRDDGGAALTAYTVATTDGGVRATVGAGSTTATLTGLVNGTPYAFVVTAANAVGSSRASQPSAAVTPAGAPRRMGRPGVTVRGTSATVSWRTAAANGSPVTGYTVLVSGERARQVSSTRRRAVVRGISRGAHTVRVTATNAVGTSRPSAGTTVRVR